jgi:hypothetical protein
VNVPKFHRFERSWRADDATSTIEAVASPPSYVTAISLPSRDST